MKLFRKIFVAIVWIALLTTGASFAIGLFSKLVLLSFVMGWSLVK